MNKVLVSICFFWPLASNCLNIQNLLAKVLVLPEQIIQLYAYSNLILIIVGVFLIKNKVGKLSLTNRLWLIFFLIYYCFALWSSGVNGYKTSIIATFIPIIYFIGFNFLLSNKEYFKIFFKVITLSFLICSILTVILFNINYSLDTGGIYTYSLDRASGLYGDANNAALASIISYVLFDKLYAPKNMKQKLLKISLLSIVFYSLFLTFSTTGLFVFTIIFLIINYKFFTGIRISLLAGFLVLFYIVIFSLKNKTQNLNLSQTQIDKVDNIINVLTLDFNRVDNSGRAELASHIMTDIYKNPILGNGVDFGVTHRAHNTYLAIWADAGVITLIFFIYILLSFMFKSLQLEVRMRSFCVSLLLVLYIFMMALQTVINQPYLIVIFVLIGYIIDNSKNKIENKELFLN